MAPSTQQFTPLPDLLLLALRVTVHVQVLEKLLEAQICHVPYILYGTLNAIHLQDASSGFLFGKKSSGTTSRQPAPDAAEEEAAAPGKKDFLHSSMSAQVASLILTHFWNFHRFKAISWFEFHI